MVYPNSTMTAVTAPEQASAILVQIIDFKWLMAGEGHRVHVEHLQTDRDYACACLALAGTSRVEALRDTAARLARAMGVALPVPTPPAAPPAQAAESQDMPPATA